MFPLILSSPINAIKTIVGIFSFTLSMLTYCDSACQGQTTADQKNAAQIPSDCPFALPPPLVKSTPPSKDLPLRGYISAIHPVEKAVFNALRWLAKHQMPDGSWNADHRKCPNCNGDCKNAGALDSPMGATAMSLLAFIGNGNSIRRGEYRTNVNAGFQYIVRTMKVTADAGDCMDKEGKMYSHGLCTIALCEEYHVTRDEPLRRAAQSAINFLGSAQDLESGGWGLEPRTRGDTNLFGIQMLALTSGRLAGLQIKPDVLDRARRFLDSVQQDEGGAYGLIGPGDSPQTNAIGLLCRAYLDGDRNGAGFKKGVERLTELGVSRSNLCYNYFASQLIYDVDAEGRSQWHRNIREMPISLQGIDGHEAGSWYFSGDPANDAGGRLYCTAMTCLTLQIYYRHLPLWQRQRLKLQ